MILNTSQNTKFTFYRNASFMKCSVPQQSFREQTLQMDLWVEEQTSRMLLWKTKKSVQRILQMLLRNMQKIHRFRLFFIWITVRTLIPVKQRSKADIHLL